MAPTHVPIDIITEILSRLPVKSLMRFKCVSISFYNLISNDTLFRKKHLYHQSSFKKVILVPDDFKTLGGNSVYPCPLLSLSPEGDVLEDMIDIELPAREGDPIHGQVHFHNSCDGLFCISMSEGDAVIWNPTTRQARRFQGCYLGGNAVIGNPITRQVTRFQLGDPSWIGYSLAHDSRSDVYKLLGLSIYGYNTYRLFFYSAEMETWRYIDDSSCAHGCDYVEYDGKPTIVNGAFHWLGSSEKEFRMPHVVVSLDISDETYGSLALPQAICDNSRGPILYELKGKLCIFSEHTSQFRCDLWVMNEYGAMDSMIRMFRIASLELPDIFFLPFHMLEHDTLIIYSSGQIYVYKDGRVLRNTSDGGYKFSMDPYVYFEMNPYVYFESLISPHTCLQGKAFNHKIIPNGFSAPTSCGKHSSNTVPEDAFSLEIVANNFSPITSRDKHVAKKQWQKSCLQRLCFL